MALQLIVTGDVQGVFYRAFVEETAKKLGIHGFVKNLENGAVEVYAEGSEEMLQEFVNKCKKGPVAAHVKGVKVLKTKDKGIKGFLIEY
jgi:acylphosphatase